MAVPGMGLGDEMNRWAFAAMKKAETARTDCLNIMLRGVKAFCKERRARSLALKMLLYR